jgi:hypothetical protein
VYRILILAAFTAIATGIPAKDVLTEKESIAIQENREISRRVDLYMDAAMLRLKTAEERLAGKEPEQGDPFEFFMPEDLVQNYIRLLRTLMYNIDDVYQRPRKDQNIGKALKSLKGNTEKAGKELERLKKIAEDQEKEQLWNLVNQAIDLTSEALKGSEDGLSQPSSSPASTR